MNYISRDIVLLEVPGEISLGYSITGCIMRCKGCHSPDLWSAKNGIPLTDDIITSDIESNLPFITCLLFFGGEWCPDELISKLKIAKNYNLATCLYTGENKDGIPRQILQHLTYIKCGSYVAELGGLDSKITNQKLINLVTGEDLTSKFQGR